MNTPKEIDLVVIDANILIKNWDFLGKGIKKLIAIKDIYDFKIYLPAVAHDEIVANYRSEYEAAYDKSKKSIDDLNRFNAQKIDTNLITTPEKATKLFRRRLKKFLKENNIETIKYPKTRHNHIVAAMYRKTPPFGDQKATEKGYKDFLIINSIIEKSKGTPSSGMLVLLSENIRDFISKDDADKKNHGILPLDKSHGQTNIWIASSSPKLFSSIKPKPGAITSLGKINKSSLGESIKQLIEENDFMASGEIIGHHTVSISKTTATCEVRELKIEFDEDLNYLKIDGIANIKATYDFEASGFDLFMTDEDFAFIDILKSHDKEMQKIGNDDWSEEFREKTIEREVLFSYLDFDYNKDTIEILAENFILQKL